MVLVLVLLSQCAIALHKYTGARLNKRTLAFVTQTSDAVFAAAAVAPKTNLAKKANKCVVSAARPLQSVCDYIHK